MFFSCNGIKDPEGTIGLRVTETNGTCAVGERVGDDNRKEGRIPVLSCEGACIRGEIARLAANLVAKSGEYRRCCHGELFTVPGSSMAQWARSAAKVICIDGCFLKCHSRILENMIEPERLYVFDALSKYRKYNDLFDIDDVPEAERKETARLVAEWVIESMASGVPPARDKKASSAAKESGCGGCGS